VSYLIKTLDLNYQIEYFDWRSDYLKHNMGGAWNIRGVTMIATYVDHNSDYLLAIL
jgi:hypothetical protein